MCLDDRTTGTVRQVIMPAVRAAKNGQACDRDVDPGNLFVEIDVGEVEPLAAIAAIESLHVIFRRKDVSDVHGCSQTLRAKGKTINRSDAIPDPLGGETT
jgi:hypothetical protein